jgi:hypothetical protein
VIAPIVSRSAIGSVVSDRPAAVNEVIVHRSSNESDLWMVSAGAPAELRACFYPTEQCERSQGEKSAQNEANCGIRNIKLGMDLSRYCSEAGKKTKPIRLSARPMKWLARW